MVINEIADRVCIDGPNTGCGKVVKFAKAVSQTGLDGVQGILGLAAINPLSQDRSIIYALN
jgi:hypothetical protein